MRELAKRLVRRNGRYRASMICLRLPYLDTMPFAVDFMKVKLPHGKIGPELAKGAFLGFRRHSVDRFIKSLVLYGNDTLERSRLGHPDSCYSHSIDVILQSYIQRMPLEQLLVLYQLNLKCIMSNSEVKYSFIEAVSSSIASYMEQVTSCDTVGDFLESGGQCLRTRSKRHRASLCKFLFQHREDLLKCRKDALQYVDNCNHAEPGFVTLTTIKRESDTVCNSGGQSATVEAVHTGETDKTLSENVNQQANKLQFSEQQGVSKTPKEGPNVDHNNHESEDLMISNECNYRLISYNPSSGLLPMQTRSEDCFLSTEVMSLVLCHIFAVKFWQRGFPVNIWINQYFAHNAAMYHPIFPMLYIANVVALADKNGNPRELDIICGTLKNDLSEYAKRGFFEEQNIVIRVVGKTYETRFGVTEMVDMFSTVKRLANHHKSRQVYPLVVDLLAYIIKHQMKIDPKLLNSVANVCNRNDGIGGFENLLEVLEEKALKHIESVTFLDVCGLLQAMYKHDLHSQELVDAMAAKMNTYDMEDINVSTLALSIQTLGRMQANLKNQTFLYKIADMFVNHPNRFIEASESNCSGILWGFYKLHFKHPKFLEVALKRYAIKELSSFNVNSLVISLTALARFDAFTDAAVLIEIYNVVLRNICSITISTAQQLITCITRLQENIKICCSDNTNYRDLINISSKVINSTMKHVCERMMDQLSTVQAGAMLNALYRSRHRTHEIIAPLLASITGSYKRGTDWHSCVHMPKKNIYLYDALPPCPFEISACKKKLEKVEVTHLVGICEAIHGLDYWSPLSLHLMLQIKEHIRPQLHDMKATHILAACISFVNWPFTDFQMDKSIDPSDTSQNLTNSDIINAVQNVVEHDAGILKERSESWFEESPTESLETIERFRVIMRRSIWKENYFLECIESLHRHAHYLCAASLPLRRMKIMYDLLRFNVYLGDFLGDTMESRTQESVFCSIQCPFLILEHKPPLKPALVAAIMPQNMIHFHTQLYETSRTESFYNFLCGESITQEGSATGIDEDEETQVEPTDCLEVLQYGKGTPKIRPIYMKFNDDEKTLDLGAAYYHKHQGSGAILELKSRYIYVDPVIGGYRCAMLVLDARNHYIPHLVENIYNSNC